MLSQGDVQVPRRFECGVIRSWIEVSTEPFRNAWEWFIPWRGEYVRDASRRVNSELILEGPMKGGLRKNDIFYSNTCKFHIFLQNKMLRWCVFK